ncbi:MAG: hypothetical protein KAR44_12285 [Candidatus Aegiribacteria sp.]|nr:hypothetical protein [Candidatus Aegiribacteria sp.]
MSWFTGLWLALLGILAAPNLIISKKPEAKEIIAKIAPYQGWIGAGSAVWGLIKVFQTFRYFSFFSVFPIGVITLILVALLTLVLGLLLGIGVIKTFVGSEDAKAKIDEMMAKLAAKQGILGLLGIIVGIWFMLYVLLNLGF